MYRVHSLPWLITMVTQPTSPGMGFSRYMMDPKEYCLHVHVLGKKSLYIGPYSQGWNSLVTNEGRKTYLLSPVLRQGNY